MARHLKDLRDYSEEEILRIIELGIKVKKNPEVYHNALHRKVLAMLFQKTSTRTRCSFEAGMAQLGGHAMYLDWRTTNFTLGDVNDEIKCLDRYADIIMARVYKHEIILAMTHASRVPVINALCDKHHPCQILGDLMTIKEKLGKFKGVKLAYIGDGNNVCNSLITGCTKTGIKISIATPKGYEPLKEIIDEARKTGLLEITHEPKEAAIEADIIYTDTWVSMGQEEEREQRLKAFEAYKVTKEILGSALFMHCLPAHRNYEVSDEAMDSKNSIIFDQAENRMHIQKAIMLFLMGKA